MIKPETKCFAISCLKTSDIMDKGFIGILRLLVTIFQISELLFVESDFYLSL